MKAYPPPASSFQSHVARSKAARKGGAALYAVVLLLGLLAANRSDAQSMEVKNLTGCYLYVRLFIYGGTCPDDNYNSTLLQEVDANTTWSDYLDPGKYVKGSEIWTVGASGVEISTSCSNWSYPDEVEAACSYTISASQDGNNIRVSEP